MGRSRLIIGASVALTAIVAAIVIWRAGLGQELKRNALELAKKGDFSEAEPALKAALDREPRDVDLLRALAKGYLKSDRKNEAEDCLTRWLAQEPGEPEALLLRIDLYRELGQFDKALADSNQLLEIDATIITWRRKRVAVLFSASRFAEAETDCKYCLGKLPRDAGLLRLLAEIQRARGELDAAGASLDSVLRDSPRDAKALMARALLHLNQDEPDKSIPLLRKVVEQDQKRQRWDGRYYLALALHRVGQKEEAERLEDEVRRMQDAALLLSDADGQPDNVPLQLRNARAQFENNDLPRAAKILRHVLSVAPNDRAAHSLMADVLEKQGHADQAAHHRRRAKDNP